MSSKVRARVRMMVIVRVRVVLRVKGECEGT